MYERLREIFTCLVTAFISFTDKQPFNLPPLLSIQRLSAGALVSSSQECPLCCKQYVRYVCTSDECDTDVMEKIQIYVGRNRVKANS